MKSCYYPYAPDVYVSFAFACVASLYHSCTRVSVNTCPGMIVSVNKMQGFG